MAIELGVYEAGEQLARYNRSYQEAIRLGDTVSIGYYRSLLIAYAAHIRNHADIDSPPIEHLADPVFELE